MKYLLIITITIALFLALVVYAMLSVPLSEYDRRIDDEQQMEALKILNRERQKGEKL